MRSDVLQAAAAADADTEKETVESATFNSLRLKNGSFRWAQYGVT
jgi:hypothetical protein